MVLLTALEPAAVEHGLLPALPALARRHRVVLASVRDPELERMAARRRQHRRRSTTRRPPSRSSRTGPGRPSVLGVLGVDVVDADADRLPVALTDHYLMLKGRGLL